ncbi:hypothetical protein LAZ67_2003210 [Cordylochernes scorpioides]|uniref:Retrovirus-related Pol polyprotein from transposon TNT 1-94 n=1 Tax=Cordylochernes scorpioides TaxID=51811 RepID=A0ABY6K795_9ARAC|nr:hypothetical protein LAZ67_2003210 [Cordylochernes scorpioides]
MYKCFICHKQGHKANECGHNPENNGKTMVKQASQPGPSGYKTNTPNKYQKTTIVKEEKASEFAKLVKERKNLDFGKVENLTERKIKSIGTDNGTEFVNNEMATYLKGKGIQHQRTTFFSPQQNGKAERFNRTLIEGTRALLIESQLPTKFWAEAMNTFVYVKNRTPSKNNEIFTPGELFSNRKPTLSHLKIFGCHAKIFIPKHIRSKLECTTQSGIFVGYSSERKAYRICDPKDFSITESRYVKFLEDKKGAALLDNDNTTKTQDYSLIEIFENDNSEKTFSLQKPEDVAESQEENLISHNQTSPRYNLRPNVRDQIYYELSSDEEPIFDNEDKDPTYEPDEEAFKVSHGDLLPSSYEEAISDPDSTLWRQAMNKEIHSLKDRHVWNLIELPQGAKPIKSKWVFSKKIDPLTNKGIFKARLVALGCSQKYGTDYNETFSPVMKTDYFRTLLAYATMMDYEFHHFDVETAFFTSLHLGRPLKVLTKYRQSWSRQSGKFGNVHTKNEDTIALRKFRKQIKVELGAKDGYRSFLLVYMVNEEDLGDNRRELALRAIRVGQLSSVCLGIEVVEKALGFKGTIVWTHIYLPRRSGDQQLTQGIGDLCQRSGKFGNVHTKNEDTIALRKFRKQIKVELGAKDGYRSFLLVYMVNEEDLGDNRRELALRVKALKFYKELKESEPSTSSRESNPQFSASTGWLTGFIKRHYFHNLKIKGEVASADEEAARKYPEKLAKIIKDGGYCAHQIFNADETGLFWKKMPTRTYIAKSEKNASGFKAAKDRVTLLLCSNASGDRILKPLLVNRSLKPHHVALAIAEIKSQILNACWKAAWPECVSKRNESNRTTIVTSGIISIAKEIGGEGFDDFGEHDIEELLVDEALNDDDILESMVDTTKDFETVDSELEDVTPLDEKLLREGLQLSGKLEFFFIQNDNDVERALKFQRDLKFCMSGYRELYKELVKPSQRLITDYLVKEKKITEVPKEALPCRSDDVILSSSDESDLAPIHKRVRTLSDSE